ncbi:hypothetical protein C8F04DRAFT_180802 [Mycena alexandri]|uniref:Uncharacterized protein n=1 Tax=Mycena alexandri TaxID=1745969 RepID=A0AAD6SDL9_9AGAR|nr:hypothetical protein C8F04DRAFT_180802 [Mycena alexandri]
MSNTGSASATGIRLLEVIAEYKWLAPSPSQWHLLSMYRTPSHSKNPTEAGNIDNARFGLNEGSQNPLLESPPSTLLEKAGKVPPKPWFQLPNALRLLSFALHSLLIAIHVGLLIVWSNSLEHRVVFSLDRQRTVSFVITAVTTTFGTIYSALLVFVTQTLSTRRSLQMSQTVTAIHDSAAAWTGIGSAVLHLWRQTAAHGSILAVLSPLAYLGNILVLHITTPALFSVAAFNSSHGIPVEFEHHMPVYNWSDGADGYFPDIAYLGDYMEGSLYSLPSVLSNTTSPGLHEATLYDVLDNNEGVGHVVVNATGFNITCGYPPHANMSFAGESLGWLWWDLNVDDGGPPYLIPVTQPSMIRPIANGPNAITLIMYSTIPIVDSSDSHPPLLNFTPAMNESVSSVQILKCILGLVPQKVTLEAKTQAVITVEPEIKKTTSSWAQYTGPVHRAGSAPYNDTDIPDVAHTPNGNLFIDLWMTWYLHIPPTSFPFSTINPKAWSYRPASLTVPGVNGQASAADMYLLQKLNLHEPNSTYSPNDTVTLHDVENALSSLVAAMFWTSTHILPSLGTQYNTTDESATGTPEAIPFATVAAPKNPVPLSRGITTVTGASTEGRLDSSLIAIIAGLVASILLALLALPSIYSGRDRDIPIDGTGILHAIWMYRNHPELDVLLPQVDDPTNDNLRQAGMVRTRLVGPGY